MIARFLPLLILALAGCAGPITGLYPPPPSQPTHEVYICNNHWHTGIVLNTADLSPRGQTYLKRFSDFPWVEIGWGDDDFYRAPKATAGLALQAMFHSQGTVLHIVGIWPDPRTFYKTYSVTLDRVNVSEAGYRKMEKRILDSFAKDDQDKPKELEKGLYGYSRFYAGGGNYWLGHTCNNWTAEALRQTGYPITPCYSMMADNVSFQLAHGKYKAERVMESEQGKKE